MNSFDFCLSASHNRYEVNDPVKVNVGFVPYVIAGMITKAFYRYLFTTALLSHNCSSMRLTTIMTIPGKMNFIGLGAETSVVKIWTGTSLARLGIPPS